MSFFSYLFSKLTSNFSFLCIFLFIFLHFLFCYFVLTKTQFHHTKHFDFNSFHFYYISNNNNHNFTPILFLLFSKSKNSFSKKNTNFSKFTQNAHFTSISFLSPQFVHLESSSHITPHHYPTHHHSPPKIIQKSHKNSFFCKIPNYPFLPTT